MSRFEYAVVSFEDPTRIDEAAETLGLLFDLCAEGWQMDGDGISALFLASGIARQFEVLNAKFTCGMTARELGERMLLSCGAAVPERGEPPCAGASVDAWLGEVLVRYQTSRGIPYERLFEAISYDELRAVYYGHEDCSFEEVALCIDGLIERHGRVNRLRDRRTAAGLTQQQLAVRSGVSVRAIQQYEQGAKDVNKAAAVTVLRLSRALGCMVEDLLL